MASAAMKAAPLASPDGENENKGAREKVTEKTEKKVTETKNEVTKEEVKSEVKSKVTERIIPIKIEAEVTTSKDTNGVTSKRHSLTVTHEDGSTDQIQVRKRSLVPFPGFAVPHFYLRVCLRVLLTD